MPVQTKTVASDSAEGFQQLINLPFDLRVDGPFFLQGGLVT